MSNPSGPRLPDSSGSLADLFDPSRVIVTDPLMLMCDSLAIRGGATSTGRYCRAVKWGIATVTQDVANRTATLEAVMDLVVSNPHVLCYGNCSQTLPV